MKRINYSWQKTNLVFAITLTVVSIMQLPAKPNPKNSIAVRFIEPILEKEPENRGAPGDRKGAGSRGSEECRAIGNKPPLTALVPLMERKLKQKQTGSLNSKFVLSLTTSEYPTFWFHVPYAGKDISSLKFFLLDEQNNPVTKEPIPIKISETPGVISVQLPKTEKALEIGKYYHWYFLVDCNPQSRSEDISIEGLVQRIAPKPDFMRRIEAATPQQRVALYANEGIWQDALTVLGELRRTKPQDTGLAAEWKDLLTSVELGNIASEPIVR